MKCVVGHARALALDLEDGPCGQRQNRRIDVVKIPLIGGNLPVGVHVPLAQHQEDLLLGELRIDVGQGDAMETQIPGSEPRELPFVRHRDHVARKEMRPVVVASFQALRWRGWLGRVALQPVRDDIVIILLRPQHAGEGLARHQLAHPLKASAAARHCRTHPPPLYAALRAASKSAKGASSGCAVAQRRQAQVESDGLTGVDGAADSARRLWCRWRPG